MAKYPPKYPAKKPNGSKGNGNSPKIEKPEPIGKITSASIRDVKFKIVTAERGLPTKAQMAFSMNYDDGKLNTVKMKLDMLACWIDPNTNNCIEAYAVFGGPEDLQEDAKLLRRIIAAVPIIRVIASPGFVVTGLGDCLRYSTKQDAGEYSSDNELYDTVEFFPSKYSAIMKVLAILERYNAVAGFQSADLNLVDDSLLESVGFFKVDDAVGNGSLVSAPPYWGVNASEMFAVGDTAGGRHVDYRERDRQVTKMAVLFADKLRRTIESIGQEVS